jgi:NAD(P)-dependent dehydrogenase (short-subunit alcohol dehydrogenase family)
MSDKKTAIVRGAQQGIGAGLVEGFLKASYNIVATSLNACCTRPACDEGGRPSCGGSSAKDVFRNSWGASRITLSSVQPGWPERLPVG